MRAFSQQLEKKVPWFVGFWASRKRASAQGFQRNETEKATSLMRENLATTSSHVVRASPWPDRSTVEFGNAKVRHCSRRPRHQSCRRAWPYKIPPCYGFATFSGTDMQTTAALCGACKAPKKLWEPWSLARPSLQGSTVIASAAARLFTCSIADLGECDVQIVVKSGLKSCQQHR